LQTREGQPLFDTATSRHSGERLMLRKGQTVTAMLTIDLNVQSGVFRFGFSLTDKLDQRFLYCSYNVKQVVLTGDCKSNGWIHMNSRAELLRSRSAAVEQEPVIA
jgi:hypothetical protein